MRWGFFLVSLAALGLGGCALVSGLDKLQIGDGGAADGGRDASDAARDVAPDAPKDTGSPITVSCGSATCTGSQVCCRSTTDAGATFACAATCAAPIACDGPEDCGNGSCCSKGGSAECKANCTGQEDTVCTQGGAPCSGAKTCLPAPAGANLPPGYFTCQ
jgi:hypothetical protein